MVECYHCAIAQKSDIKDNNFRPISLLCVGHSRFTKIKTNRISSTPDTCQLREQAVFHSYYSTTDHIHVLNHVVKKSSEYNKHLCMVFIDYKKKTFDSGKISALMQSISIQVADEPYIKLLEEIYIGSTVNIKVH